ncbi:hypothetical protein, partial [Sphingobium sp. MP9-4]|uniref:hypothetical protein n=1 Tax=Sphingobium sp. MP9-4 TaxID=1761936 RepID=UPI0019D0C0FE
MIGATARLERYHAGWLTGEEVEQFASRPQSTVGSTGGGNTCLETLCGRLIFERFPWPFVELP